MRTLCLLFEDQLMIIKKMPISTRDEDCRGRAVFIKLSVSSLIMKNWVSELKTRDRGMNCDSA